MSFLQINIPSLCESKALEFIGTCPMKSISSLIKVASYMNLLGKIDAWMPKQQAPSQNLPSHIGVISPWPLSTWLRLLWPWPTYGWPKYPLALPLRWGFHTCCRADCRAPLTNHWSPAQCTQGLLGNETKVTCWLTIALAAFGLAHLLTDGARTSVQRPRDEQKNQSGKQQPSRPAVRFGQRYDTLCNRSSYQLHSIILLMALFGF